MTKSVDRQPFRFAIQATNAAKHAGAARIDVHIVRERGQTPLWSAIYMLPLTAGFLLAGPASGAMSDRFGARAFASGLHTAYLVAAGFALFTLLSFADFVNEDFGRELVGREANASQGDRTDTGVDRQMFG